MVGFLGWNLVNVHANAIRRREAERGGGGRQPVIALTAGVTAEEREATRLAGMDGFLTKPLQTTALSAVLADWLPERGTAPT